MSVNKEVIGMLKELNYPVEFMNYDGNKLNYFVFNFDDERSVHFGDDTPIYETYSMQLHFFCEKTFNYLELKDKVKKILFNNGWSYPTTYQLYEQDNNHIVFSTEKEILIEWQK